MSDENGKKKGSAERMRRHRLRKDGYEGKPSPVSPERVVEGLTKPEKEDALAWAQGVWQRQGEEAERSRKIKHDGLRDSLIEAGIKNVPADFAQDTAARAERARKYAEWREQYLAENPPEWP